MTDANNTKGILSIIILNKRLKYSEHIGVLLRILYYKIRNKYFIPTI